MMKKFWNYIFKKFMKNKVEGLIEEKITDKEDKHIQAKDIVGRKVKIEEILTGVGTVINVVSVIESVGYIKSENGIDTTVAGWIIKDDKGRKLTLDSIIQFEITIIDEWVTL